MIYLNKFHRYGIKIEEILKYLVDRKIETTYGDFGEKIHKSRFKNGIIGKILESPVHGKRCGEKNYFIEFEQTEDEIIIRKQIRSTINFLLK